jgi:RimJ/RimL family protein N-acetyltransferase
MLVLKTFAQPLELRTRRTLLRHWKDSDLPWWAAMNADPEVRRHFASVSSTEEALGEAQRIRAAIDQRGWGMWALEIPGEFSFAGTVGLFVTAIDAAFVPCVELGWRLSTSAWGRGYAAEAAHAAADFGFEQLGLEELVAYTIPANQASLRVMASLGMQHDPGSDFDHPRLPPAHPMRPHVLYRLRRDAFNSNPPRMTQ